MSNVTFIIKKNRIHQNTFDACRNVVWLNFARLNWTVRVRLDAKMKTSFVSIDWHWFKGRIGNTHVQDLVLGWLA